MARSTWLSSILTPPSLASCSSARWVIRRSSTCLSSTSAAGGCTFCCLSCCCTIRRASSSSYWVSASSLTMATTRSTLTTADGFAGCAQTPAAQSASAIETMRRTYMIWPSELRKIVGDCATERPHRRLVARQIARHATLEDVDRIGTEPCETVQFELHEYRLARLFRRRGQALGDDAQRPAVAIVLEARHALQRLAVDQRVVPAADERPLTGQRKLP